MGKQFNVGDRVKSDSHHHLSDQFHNQTGTVIKVGHGSEINRWVQVELDDVPALRGNEGWDFAPERLSLIDEEPTEAEIVALFGIKREPGTPGPDSTLVELLECIDDALRNGRMMTRANLAFEYLLQHHGMKREDLPAYVADIARIEAESEI